MSLHIKKEKKDKDKYSRRSFEALAAIPWVVRLLASAYVQLMTNMIKRINLFPNAIAPAIQIIRINNAPR